MLEINKRNIRFLSRLGAQGSLGQAVFDLAESGKKMYVLSADLGVASGFERVMKNYPELFADTGIAEQNLLAVAAGVCDDDCPAIATTWSTFATYRAADQMRVFMGIMKKNIILVGMGSGMHIPYFGASHYGIGDVSVALSIPGIDVVAPSDGVQIYQAVVSAVENDHPTYIRLTGGDTLPMLYNEVNNSFAIGKANTLVEGDQILIISCGSIIVQALECEERLRRHGLSCMVVDMHTIRPLDDEILEKAKGFELVVTIEEHNSACGLGSAVAKRMSVLDINTQFCAIGIEDFFPIAGSYEYLLDQCGLDSTSLFNHIMEKYNRVKRNE